MGSPTTKVANVTYYYYYIATCECLTPAFADGLLLASKWQQVSSTSLMQIWMASNCPLISNFSSPITKSLGTILSYSLYHRITFFRFLARSKYLSLFSISSIFTLWSAGATNSTARSVFLSVLIFTRSGHLL